ncbi:hypothetical protein D2E51_23855 [Mycobacteroides abscessus]|nr:hypothetical protein DDT53_13845 [Mycobacteroides abscessus]AWG59990.1 hypothetical protein DDT47_13780 [Mycobacteroides abscessus]AWG69136.1 hypothetical protein DDT49_10570 [Mycobacteroides abscessus]PVA69966.1 hypothetical protein DDJ87_05430 [Mycobacteroides abscessus]PVA98003.1 hypothetical protein DDJ62_21980 [Mycobacteroides abscessus]
MTSCTSSGRYSAAIFGVWVTASSRSTGPARHAAG